MLIMLISNVVQKKSANDGFYLPQIDPLHILSKVERKYHSASEIGIHVTYLAVFRVEMAMRSTSSSAFGKVSGNLPLGFRFPKSTSAIASPMHCRGTKHARLQVRNSTKAWLSQSPIGNHQIFRK
jgi:hypothetical protein